MKAILGYGIPLDTNDNLDKITELIDTVAFHNLEIVTFYLDESISGPTCIMQKGYQVVGETEEDISPMESGLDLLTINNELNIEAFRNQMLQLFGPAKERTMVVNSRWIFGITIDL